MLLKQFSQLSRDDVASAGGKGASLGEMTQAGIPVPPGFVILASAFERFLEEEDLAQEIEAILDSVKHDQIHTVEHASEKIQALILNAKMSEDVACEIAAQFRTLGAKYVAVRSSATAEDGSTAAWAGQLDTFLNTTEAELTKKVQRCWASLFTPRAIFYRFEKGMHKQKISVAVVVQQMIQSEMSGIAFSVHPVTEDHNQLIIEAGYGLGEAIVSGQVTPDAYVVEKDPRRILDKNIATQNRGLYRAAANGNEWRNIAEPKASSQVLNDIQIFELSDLIIKIENHYGFPCDIEWALEKGKFYITQSRPITTLSNTPFGKEKQPLNPHVELLKWGPTPLYPLLRYQTFVSGFFVAFPKCYPHYAWPKTLILSDKKRFIWICEYDEICKAGAKLFMEMMLPKEKREAVRTKWKQALLALNRSENAIGNDVSSFSDKKLSAMWTEFHQLTDTFWAHASLPELSNYGSTEHLAEELKKVIPESEVASVMETLRAPEEMSFYQKEEIDLVEADDVGAHQRKYFWLKNSYAHVEVLPVTFFKDRKKKIPSNIRDTVAARLRRVGAAKDKLCKKYNIPKRLRDMGDAIADGIAWQDARKKDIWVYLHYEDVMLQDIARRMGVEKDLLTFAAHEEIPVLFSGAMSADELLPRRSMSGMYAESGRTEAISARDATAYWKLYVDVPHDTETKEFEGIIASKGKVRGRVKIILDPYGHVGFDEGDVLVTTMTTPEFIFVMKKACAVITDTGGLTSHAAIVSRELNVPCLVGTKIATQVLKDGDVVEVDADAGVVRILERPAPIFRKEDYLLAFWVQGVSVFVADIHNEIYRDLEALFIIDDGMFKQYFTNKAYARALERGLAFYSDEQAFDTYREDLAAHCSSFKDFFEREIRNAKTLSKNTVTTFFDYTKKLCGEYTKMNFEFTDRAFLHQDKDQTIRKNLAGVGAFKDIVRTLMNTVLFEPGGFTNQLFRVLGKQFRLPSSVFDNLTQKEILALFDGEMPNESVVSERQKAFVESYNLDPFYEGVAAETILQEFSEQVERTKTIQGQIARKGKVRGKVKIIPVDYSDLGRINAAIEQMQQGDILVAETTAPELIVACKKAGAIVTDMGGLMSHAAIVSREMGIPCIVGTKNASKILKDGDVVEVDATKGVVRIITI